MAGTTVSLRYCPVAPVPPPWTSILVALEPTTSTLPFSINPPAQFFRWLPGHDFATSADSRRATSLPAVESACARAAVASILNQRDATRTSVLFGRCALSAGDVSLISNGNRNVQQSAHAQREL